MVKAAPTAITLGSPNEIHPQQVNEATDLFQKLNDQQSATTQQLFILLRIRRRRWNIFAVLEFL